MLAQRRNMALFLVGLASVGSWLLLPAYGQTRGSARKPQVRALLNFEKDYLAPIVGDGAPLKPGVRVELAFVAPKRPEEFELTEVQTGRDKQSLQAVGVKNSAGKTQKLQAAAIARFVVDGKSVYEVVQDPEKKTFLLLDAGRRDQVVEQRLKPQRHRLWKEPTEAEQEAALVEHKAFIQKVQAAFPNRVFAVHETEYFLFCTDMPLQQIGPYVANLDAMYAEMCGLFGVRQQTNIWLGKCVVIAFQNKEDYAQFEATFYNVNEVGTSQGKCHSHGDGRVVMACYRGANPTYFAALLVHETSHGFLHRFRSTMFIPSWINEGIADYVAGLVIPASQETSRRQKEAVQQMAGQGSLLGIYEASGQGFQRVHYGVASSLTQFMIQQSPLHYRGLLTAIKEGTAWKEALGEVYGLTPEELAVAYGRSVGIPNLRP